MCNLHWYYTFCTGVTLFLHSFLSQSESSNFFMYVIMGVILLRTWLRLKIAVCCFINLIFASVRYPHEIVTAHWCIHFR